MSEPSTRGITGLVKKNLRKERESKGGRDVKDLIKDYPLFRAIKPKQRYLFRSDYMEIDNSFATILSILHHQGSDDNLSYFWGINLIPRNLGSDVSVRKIEHVGRMSESWVDGHQGRAESLLGNQESETARDGSMTARQKLSKRQQQLVDITSDLINGASYLKVAMRLLVKAPTLEALDDAVNKINRDYTNRFETVYVAPYTGEQKTELSNTFNKLDNKMGKGYMFTSSEFAGNYSLVTRGIEDKTGEFIGKMVGDVNNSAVLMDIDDYSTNVVIAGDLQAKTASGHDFRGTFGSDVWGIKLGFNALLRNQKVVHLVLNDTRVADIGVDLSDITTIINMTKGDINPFEMFGSKENELAVFSSHVDKVYLMLEQLALITDEKSARVNSSFKKSMNDFYVDKSMWAVNAPDNRDALRIVGIPHKQYPRLQDFITYLDMEYQAQKNSTRKDLAVQDAYGFLEGAFRDMLNTNGDLFNTYTSNIIDRAVGSARVIYDFSALYSRSEPLMMAQFVNALGYAVGNLSDGDLVVLHGADFLRPGIKQYVSDQFNRLHRKNVRTAFIYSDIDKMILDKDFNNFERADYTLLGGMVKSTIDRYETSLNQDVPVNLKNLLEHKLRDRWYLRRGFDNVVFENDIQMGFN